MQQFRQSKQYLNRVLSIIKLVINFCFFLFISIFYQKFFGEEPFNNSFAMGLPRFYCEYYVDTGVKLTGFDRLNFWVNIILYLCLVFLIKYIKVIKR